MMSMNTAPEFTVKNQRGEDVTLSQELKSNKVLLYFYPKDMTPGCTLEGIGFSQHKSDFEKHDVKVFGVSADSVDKHQKFCEKESLTIDLLSDESKEMLEAYGVWKEKSMFGKKYMGISRETFLIGQDSTIIKHWNTVKPAAHPKEVLAYIQSL
jgi:peroxiredoxin Q/BCP